MASLPSTTHGCGRFIELGQLPRQRDGLGTDNVILVLAQSIGSATDTILRNCDTFAALVTAGVVEANFTNYGEIVLGPTAITISYVTTSSPYSASLSIATQTWNPAGGAINNNAIVKSFLLYRPTPTTPTASCYHLGMCDAAGGATGGSYTHTFGTLTSQAT